MSSTYSHFIAGLFLIGILISLPSGSAAAERSGTVVTKSGETYNEVTFTINDNYKLITFEWLDNTYNVSFSDIKSITSESGEDITASVMGNNYPIPHRNQNWLDENSEIIKSYNQKKYIVAFELIGAFSLPSGDYYKLLKSGIGFGGSAKFGLSRKLALKLEYFRSGIGFNSRNYQMYSYDPGTTILKQDNSFRQTSFSVGLEVHRPLKRNAPLEHFYYFSIAYGITTHTLESELLVEYSIDGSTATLTGKASRSHFFQTHGGGFVYMATKSVGIDLGFDITIISVARSQLNNSAQFGFLDAINFDLRVGLVYYLR